MRPGNESLNAQVLQSVTTLSCLCPMGRVDLVHLSSIESIRSL